MCTFLEKFANYCIKQHKKIRMSNKLLHLLCYTTFKWNCSLLKGFDFNFSNYPSIENEIWWCRIAVFLLFSFGLFFRLNQKIFFYFREKKHLLHFLYHISKSGLFRHVPSKDVLNLKWNFSMRYGCSFYASLL